MSDVRVVSGPTCSGEGVVKRDETQSVAGPAAAAAVAAGHLAYLDGLRALAALYVVAHHTWLQIWVNSNRYYPSGWAAHLTGWLAHGRFAVDLFIVLSGFCLMLPLTRGDGHLRGGAVDFFKRRARRILPPYYAALAFSILMILTCVGRKTGTHWDISIPLERRSLVANALMLQDVWRQGTINHCFWSIAVEWKIYFLFPLLVAAFRRWGAIAVTTGVALVAGLVAEAFERHSVVLSRLTLHYVGLFTVGMFGAVVSYGAPGRVPAWLARAVGWPLAAASVGVLAFLYARLPLDDPLWKRMVRTDLLVGFGSVGLLVAVARSPGSALSRACGWRPLALVGTFAYSLYLTHATVLQAAWLVVGRPLEGGSPLLEFSVLLAVSIPFCLAVAYAFFLAFERPFLRKPAATAPRGAEAKHSGSDRPAMADSVAV